MALENGINKMRTIGVKLPLMIMSYFNPILSWGVDKFIRDSHDAGVNGFIIPDLLFEEALLVEEVCKNTNFGISYLLAPNSRGDRIEKYWNIAKVLSILFSC